MNQGCPRDHRPPTDQVRAPWQVCMGGARDLPQYQVIPRPGRRRNSPAWLLLERARQYWINLKMKKKTSQQICFGTLHHPASVPQGPRRAGQRLLDMGSDRQTHAQYRRGDADRGRGWPDQWGPWMRTFP